MSITPDRGEENKRTARQIGKAASSGDLDALDDVLAEDIVALFPDQDPVHGREAYKETLRTYRMAFPDFTVENHDIVAEGDTVSRRRLSEGGSQPAPRGRRPFRKARHRESSRGRYVQWNHRPDTFHRNIR